MDAYIAGLIKREDEAAELLEQWLKQAGHLAPLLKQDTLRWLAGLPAVEGTPPAADVENP